MLCKKTALEDGAKLIFHCNFIEFEPAAGHRLCLRQKDAELESSRPMWC
jgi:hypothetical protein